MRLIVPWIQRTHAGKALPGFVRLAERMLRHRPIVVGRNEARRGTDRLIKTGDGRIVLALRSRQNAEIVRDRRMARRNDERVSIRGLRLIDLPGVMMSYRSSDQLIELVRHVTRRMRATHPPTRRRACPSPCRRP